MCVFAFWRGAGFRPSCVVFSGRGAKGGRDIYARTVPAAVYLSVAIFILKAWISPTIFRLSLYLFRCGTFTAINSGDMGLSLFFSFVFLRQKRLAFVFVF